MRAWVLIVVLGAGAVRADEGPSPFLKAETSLKKKYKDRILLDKVAPALSYRPGGAKVGEPHAYAELIVVEEEGDKVRIAANGPIVRVAYYIDAKAVPIVARKGAVVTASAPVASAKPTKSSPGVRLRAGTVVELVQAAKDGVAKIRLPGGGSPTIEGFVREGAFGRGYVPEKEWKERKANVEISTPIDVLDAPGGARLAGWTDDRGVEAVRLGPKKQGHALVRIDLAPNLVVIGWVKAEAVHALPKGMLGIGGMGGAPIREHAMNVYRGPSHAPEVTRGEILYDAPDGQPVAVVLVTETHTPTGSAPPGWTQYTMPGPFGPAVLYRRRPAQVK